MTNILLLGSFHFGESNIDFCTPESQAEVEALVQKLARFSPDVVAVEWAAREQEAVSASYQKFNLEDLHDAQTMRNQTLGEIQMFGNVSPIRYVNESIMIGYRLGKLMNLPDVYAIDNDSDFDAEAIFEHPSPAFQEALHKMDEYQNVLESLSLTDRIRHVNTPEWSRMNHSIYIQANAIRWNGEYIGVRANTSWYERNLKIFCNIQNLAEQHKRIFIVYGAGHLHLLKEFINADENLNLVDTDQYL